MIVINKVILLNISYYFDFIFIFKKYIRFIYINFNILKIFINNFIYQT